MVVARCGAQAVRANATAAVRGSQAGAAALAGLSWCACACALASNLTRPRTLSRTSDGVWTGWLTSLPVLAHDRTTDDGSGASASTHLLDVTALLTKGQWLTSVMPSAAKLLKHATAAPRIVSARAHPSNLEFVVEWMSVDATVRGHACMCRPCGFSTRACLG
jgi:hypothetical protein